MRTRLARWFGDVLYHTYPLWSVTLLYLSLVTFLIHAVFETAPQHRIDITHR